MSSPFERPTEKGPRPAPADASKNPFKPEPAVAEADSNKRPSLVSEISRLRDEAGSEEAALHQLIGRGGENLVFQVTDTDKPEGVRDVVVKINVRETWGYLAKLVRDPTRLDDVMAALKSDMGERAQGLKELRTYFGRKTVPAERVVLRDVPVSRTAVETFFRTPGSFANIEFPSKVKAWVTVQERIKGMDENSVDLRGYYPEAPREDGSVLSSIDYLLAHDLLVGRTSTTGEMSQDEREVKEDTVLRMYPELNVLHSRMQDDQGLREAVKDFVKRSIAYTEGTGKFLDLVGKHNVLLIPEKKKDEEGKEEQTDWQLRMPDALLVNGEDALLSLKRVSLQAAQADEKQVKDWTSAMNSLNSVRVMNALAFLSGSPERMEVEPLQYVEAGVWRSEIQKQKFPNSAKPAKHVRESMASFEAAETPTEHVSIEGDNKK